MKLDDLRPEKDVKGGASAPGSPRTPHPIPVSEFENMPPEGNLPQPYIVHANGTVAKIVAASSVSLLAGMIVAWFTAMAERGVSKADMEQFVRQSQTDQERVLVTHGEMEAFVKDYAAHYSAWSFDKESVIARIANHDQQIGELRTKIDTAANLIKEQHDALKR